jgi:hypothetical protein
MNQTISNAINAHHVLTFSYQGYPRTVNPHLLHRDDQHGKLVFHAWQTKGQSSSRVPPCWGNFRLDEIDRLTVLAETFGDAQPDFNSARYLHVITSI